VYYFHGTTKKTTWSRPAPDPADALPLPPGWMQAKVPDGRTYYYIQGRDGKMFCSQWARPTDVDPKASAAFADRPGHRRLEQSVSQKQDVSIDATDVALRITSAASTDRPGLQWLDQNMRRYEEVDMSIDAMDQTIRITSDQMQTLFVQDRVARARRSLPKSRPAGNQSQLGGDYL
jgi:hypothetical protein